MERNEIDRKKTMNYMFLIVFGILFYVIVGNSENYAVVLKVINPLIFAFAIAYLLDPMVKFMERKLRLKRGVSILIILMALIFMIITMISIIIPSLDRSIKEVIAAINVDDISEMINNLGDKFGLNENSKFAEEILKYLSTAVTQLTTVMNGILQNFIGIAFDFTSGIFKFIVTLCIAVYMLLDKNDLRARAKRVLYAYGKKSKVDEVLKISANANEVFKRFFVGKIIDSTIIGIMCFALMFILKIPYAILLSIIIGITNMIPYFGPFIGGFPAVILVMFGADMKTAIVTAILILVLQQFDGLYLGPKILGDKVGVGAFWIIVSVTAGGAIMGVWGMLLGVPITVIVKTLIEESVQKKLDHKGLGDIEIEHIKS